MGYKMEENQIDTVQLNRAPIYSACFMGLGQIISLKQYVRGALFALVEIVFILAIIVGAKTIIPANKAEDDYIKGTPDTATLYEYLEGIGYNKLDDAKQQRAAAMKDFFTKNGPKAMGTIAYNEAMEGSEDVKDDKDEYNQLVSDAEEARTAAIEDAVKSFADDYDYTSLDDIDTASGEIAGDEVIYDKYLKLVEKFDKPLCKAMARAEANKFAKNKRDRLPAYKGALSKADANYKSIQSQINKDNKAVLDKLKADYKTEVKGLDKEARRVRTNEFDHAVDAANLEWTNALDEARFNYEDEQKVAFADYGGDNAFDEHYDGCSLCKRAMKKGKRTTMHRTWFQGPIVTSLTGLVTLGHKQNTTEANYKDHSIFKMINGLMAIIIIGFYVFLYILSITSTKRAIKKIVWNGRYPSMQEAQNDLSQNSFATIGIAPSVVMIAIFSLIPLLFSALVAFTNYSSPDHIPPNNLVDWVGLGNFVTMFSTNVGNGEWAKAFTQTAIWTLVWAVFATFSCFFVGFFYAFVLQDKRIVIPSFFRTVYILPYAIPTMLSLFVWANLLNGTIGPINRTLQLIGLIDKPVPFLSNPWVAKGSLIFVNVWIGFPYSMILTTSSMTAISASLYEAAVIDGATKWDQFKTITYPLVMFQLKPTLIMQFASNINNFGAVFFLTGGGPNMPEPGLTTATNCGATDLLISWIYKLTMNTPQRYHLASVLSLLVFAVLVPFALYNFNRATKSQEGGF